MKFSIIIPVYNVENYIKKCLDSVKSQTYDNYEAIIVNDGSPDNSQAIIDKYLDDKKFKSYKKKNGGLSDARNYGVKMATGDYLIFLDSDDYIDKKLLEKLNYVLKEKKYDMIRFGVATISSDGKILKSYHITENKDDINKSIKIITSNHFVEPACFYAYRRKFYLESKISFPKGKIHEDFGTTLIALSYAKTIRIIDFIVYYYVQNDNSIMHNYSYDKEIVKTTDFFTHHLNNRKVLMRDNSIKNKYLLNYSASCTIIKGRGLLEEDLDKYVAAIKKNHVIDDLYGNTLKRKLKKIYLRLFLKKYIISKRGKQ